MTRIIGVLNYKGGTGKTTTVVNLAAGLALRGERVLCIDMDSQGSLATYLGVPYVYSLTHLLLGQVEPHECIARARERLDIVASDSSLLDVEGELWKLDTRQLAGQRMVERLQGLEEGYDYALIDYSPSASRMSQSALYYIDELFVPVAMNYLALVGTRQVIQTLKTVSRMPERRVRLSLIIPTFYFARLRKDREVMETLQRYFDGKVTEPIRANVSLAEAPGHQMSIYEYAPQSAGAIDYARLVERVARNGQKENHG